MRRKALAGIAIAGLAVLGFTAIGLGRDGGGATATSGRHTVLTVDHKRAANGGIVYVVGSQPGAILTGDNSATLGKCPLNSVILNGAFAVADPADAPHVTIQGSGIVNSRKWFVDYANDAGTDLDGFITVVCKKTG